MNSQQEDTFYSIHTELTESGLWEEFNNQIKKMQSQDKHKWKNMCEKWEYALNRIKQEL